MYTWQQAKDPGACDRVLEMSVGGRKLGKLNYYQGVGYFAYFLEAQLNRSPLAIQSEARDLVQEAYKAWQPQHRQSA